LGLKRELKDIMMPKKYSYSLFNGKTRFLNPRKGKYKTSVCFYIMFLSVVLAKFFSVLIYIKWSLSIISIILDAIVLILHLSLISTNPGYIKKSQISMIKLLEVYEP